MSEYLQDYVLHLQGISKTPAEVERLQESSQAIAKTLQQVAGQSLFDSEPAQMVVVHNKLKTDRAK